MVFEKRIKVHPKKMEAVNNWLRPLTSSNIRIFLGLAGYYKRFIKGFYSISSPLTMLTQKNLMFVCIDKYEKSFQTLKGQLTLAPILTLLEGTGGFIVHFDDSWVCLGCVLMQHGKVIAYNL